MNSLNPRKPCLFESAMAHTLWKQKNTKEKEKMMKTKQQKDHYNEIEESL